MASIENIHDNFFRKVFSEIENVETFLESVLPEGLRRQLDFTEMALDPTSYISEEYKESLSDIVVKCRLKGEETPVEVYLLFEHKSFPDKKVLMQLLGYMHVMWQKDGNEKKPLRVIIPVVFYHGKAQWAIPQQFNRQFPSQNELQRFLLNFEYILFDANQWDWESESSSRLKQNVFLFSAILLMKAAFHQNLEIVRQVFRLWSQIGFTREPERINFLMIYIAETHDIPAPDLVKILEESKVKGVETMPTLAQRLREEGSLLGKQEALIMTLDARFHLSEAERQRIKEITETDKLNIALKMVVTTETKENILRALKNGS